VLRHTKLTLFSKIKKNIIVKMMFQKNTVYDVFFSPKKDFNSSLP
jgi:hypothetical protein